MSHHTSSGKSPAALVATLLSLTLILSACGGIIETDLTLYANDRFDATSRITLPAQSLMLIGGTEAIDSQFRELEQEAVAQGAKFSWRKENSKNVNEIVYRMTIGGTGYEGLADSFGIYVQKTEYNGQEALTVTASPNYDLSGAQNTVRLHVGKILETTNQRSDNNTILWSGTESLQAIVTPASSTNWLVILLVILAVAAVLALALIFLRRRSAGQPAMASRSVQRTASAGFCPHCGRPTQPGSRFCMNCGKAIPTRQG